MDIFDFSFTQKKNTGDASKAKGNTNVGGHRCRLLLQRHQPLKNSSQDPGAQRPPYVVGVRCCRTPTTDDVDNDGIFSKPPVAITTAAKTRLPPLSLRMPSKRGPEGGEHNTTKMPRQSKAPKFKSTLIEYPLRRCTL